MMEKTIKFEGEYKPVEEKEVGIHQRRLKMKTKHAVWCNLEAQETHALQVLFKSGICDKEKIQRNKREVRKNGITRTAKA